MYADGEALLGWLNVAATIDAPAPFDGNALLGLIAEILRASLATEGAEVAHLKMTLSPNEGNDLGVLNLVRGDGTPESLYRLQDDVQSGDLLLNLRAEGDPAFLRSAVEAVFRETLAELNIQIRHIEAFRPGKPTPTYRMATV